jgi:DNA (cytosine-5)-methyltransferase 1
MLRFLSICSGIEAASVAWEPLGYVPAGYAEIDPFASAVLAHRFGSNLPGEPLSRNAPPNFGDFTAIDGADLPKPLDVLVGGTPCQAFSVAGKRLSLADARGNLTLSFVVLAHGLADTHGLRNLVWENVPGVLNTPDNAFGCFLGALVGADDALHPPAGGGWPRYGMVAGPRARAAWRVLDAQWFGVAQRRQRVFLVADLGGGADPATVLFEPQGLRGHSPPRRETGQGPAADAGTGAGERRAFGGGGRDGEIAGTVSDKWAKGTGGPAGDELYNLLAHAPSGETFIAETAPTLRAGGNSTGGDRPYGTDVDTCDSLIAHALRGEGFDASEDGTGRGTPLVPVCFSAKDHGADAQHDLAPTLRAGGHAGSHANAGVMPAVAFGAQAAEGDSTNRYLVRRLTPDECARLQGFPDGWSRIPWRGKPAEACPDGPQYKTYGNSMAVPVMRWIGARLMAAMPPPSSSSKGDRANRTSPPTPTLPAASGGREGPRERT